MPQSIEALGGSCVAIPCRFNLASGWDMYLDDTCKAIWKRGSWSRVQVFDSSLTGPNKNVNILQGNLTGNLHQMECTTILDNLPSNNYDDYYFRLDCDNMLKFNYRTSVSIVSKDAPRNTSVSPTGPVLEGSSLTLTCSSNANPAVRDYAWYKITGDEVTAVGFRKRLAIQPNEENNRFYCEAKNRYGSQNSSLIEVDVQFPPKDASLSVSPSGTVVEGSSLTLTCTSNANPAVENYTWYKDNGGDYAIFASGQILPIDSVDASHNGNYYCEARNDHGEKKSNAVQLHIEYPPKNTSVSVLPSGPVLEGSSVTLTCGSDASPAVENYTWFLASGEEMEDIGWE
ncbi:B-cell receptor CD22-like, partial [Aplochiton taeniatus]